MLADFGIAKALQASRAHAPDGTAAVDATLTQQSIALGTPASMAHEQAQGTPRRLTEQICASLWCMRSRDSSLTLACVWAATSGQLFSYSHDARAMCHWSNG